MTARCPRCEAVIPGDGWCAVCDLTVFLKGQTAAAATIERVGPQVLLRRDMQLKVALILAMADPDACLGVIDWARLVEHWERPS